jgi:hypothetical protein
MLVNKVTLEINGLVIDDFKTVKEGKLTVTRAVNLMHKTAKIKATQRPTFSLDYAIPLDEPEFDFNAIGDDATVTIEYENGRRITYLNCSVGEIGEVTYDEEKEAIRPIDFIAEARVEE